MNIEKLTFNSEEQNIIGPEEEKIKERKENIKKALEDFAGLRNNEGVLILVDDITNNETLALFKEAAAEIGASYEIMDLREEGADRENFQSRLKNNKLIIKLAESKHKALNGAFDDDLKTYKARMLNLFAINPEVFNKDGVMSENYEELDNRLNKMKSTLKEAKGFKVKSSYGTDLTIGLRHFKERDWHKCTGKVEAGKWDNWPGGEIFTTPDEGRVNGVLVLPVLTSEISNEQGVDEFVRINIQDGVITVIEGGESARMLREHLQKDMQTELNESGNPRNVLRIAELAFGANSKARSAVTNENESFKYNTTDTVETEKRLGTIHLAFGSSKHGEEEVDGFEDTVSHYDFVIPRNGLTVEMFNSENDFSKENNGRKIISNGGINF